LYSVNIADVNHAIFRQSFVVVVFPFVHCSKLVWVEKEVSELKVQTGQHSSHV